MPTDKCVKCGQEFPVEQLFYDGVEPDVHSPMCEPCIILDAQSRFGADNVLLACDICGYETLHMGDHYKEQHPEEFKAMVDYMESAMIELVSFGIYEVTGVDKDGRVRYAPKKKI